MISPCVFLTRFTYFGSNISSPENHCGIPLGKHGQLLTLWKSLFSDQIKREHIQNVAVSVVLYSCTTRTLTKRLEKKLGVTNPESSNLKNKGCMAIYLPSLKHSFSDEDMLPIDGKAGLAPEDGYTNVGRPAKTFCADSESAKSDGRWRRMVRKQQVNTYDQHNFIYIYIYVCVCV